MDDKLISLLTLGATAEERYWFETDVEATILEVPHDRWDILKNYPENDYANPDQGEIYGKPIVDQLRKSNLRLNPHLEAELLDIPTGADHVYQQLRYGYGFLKATSLLCRYIQHPPESTQRGEIFNDIYIRKQANSISKRYGALELDLIKQAQISPIREYGSEDAEQLLNLLSPDAPYGMVSFIAMMATLVNPEVDENLHHFNVTGQRDVGECSSAEPYFTQLLPWQGQAQIPDNVSHQITIYRDKNNNPIFIEKTEGWGNHSALNLVPIIVNGVYIAAGYMHGISIKRECIQKQQMKSFAGVNLSLRDIDIVSGINPKRATVFVTDNEKERYQAFHKFDGYRYCSGIYLNDFEKFGKDVIHFRE